MPDFPRSRYTRAGATEKQLEGLQQEFDKLSPRAQEQQIESLAALSDYELAEILSGVKKTQLQTVPVVTKEPEDRPQPDPTKTVAKAQRAEKAAKAGEPDSH